MKSSRAPLFSLLILLAGFLAVVYFTGRNLPEPPKPTATHFSMSGTANDWMTRSGYLILISLLGVGLPLFQVGVFSLVRYMPKSFVNVPNRDYWLSPEHINETHSILTRHAYWLASLCTCFIGAVHVTVVYANTLNPPRMSLEVIGGIGFAFFFAMILWVMSLLNRFRVKKE